MPVDETPDIWGKTPSEYAAAKAGNGFMSDAINAAKSRQRPIGDLFGERSSSVQPSGEAERLAQAVTDLESLKRNNGTTGEIREADQRVEQIIEQSRSARADAGLAREQPRGPDGQFVPAVATETVSFDGGVRVPKGGRRPSVMAHRRQWEEGTNPNALLRQAVQASHERARAQAEGLPMGTGPLAGIPVING
jgi:hypothetical protein